MNQFNHIEKVASQMEILANQSRSEITRLSGIASTAEEQARTLRAAIEIQREHNDKHSPHVVFTVPEDVIGGYL